MKRALAAVALTTLAGCASQHATTSAEPPKEHSMQLGNFSVSLAVKDLEASRAFYEKLGFKVITASRNMAILQNDTSTIGLFHGMFDKNILTYNPGWDRSCNTLPSFDDVRDIQRVLKERGITPVLAADEAGAGPASMIVVDPDGNQILIDQHVPRAPK